MPIGTEAMKIIEPGIIKAKPSLRFKCENCGCLFEADFTEYRSPAYMEEMHDNVEAKCSCPCCKCMVYRYR